MIFHETQKTPTPKSDIIENPTDYKMQIMKKDGSHYLRPLTNSDLTALNIFATQLRENLYTSKSRQ